MPMSSNEGFVKVLGYRLFYRAFGTPRKGTILCLHGGPGATHDYLLSMADLTKEGYRVVFYDQLGCGKSDVPRDKQLFVPERYVEEVEAFRKHLKLGKIHVIGSSLGRNARDRLRAEVPEKHAKPDYRRRSPQRPDDHPRDESYEEQATKGRESHYGQIRSCGGL